MLTIGQCATLACLLEVSAPKPGNVHRGADFENLSFTDFVASAVAIAPAMEQARDQSIGETVLQSVRATRRVVDTNTNLGIVLLLAPLASIARPTEIGQGVAAALGQLTAQDSQLVYKAIRLAAPGGLDPHDEHVVQYDVEQPAPSDLLAAMKNAAERDLVARQYANGFDDVLHTVCPWLLDDDRQLSLTERIVQTHVRLMNQHPDSLIERKCGKRLAAESAARASIVLETGKFRSDAYQRALSDLDFWLRSDGTRRNPGTTADMITAGLFVLLRENQIAFPYS